MIDDIIEIIANELHIDIDDISADTDIVWQLDADSLSIQTIIMTLEDTFGITVSDEAILSIRTPALIAEYIENNS